MLKDDLMKDLGIPEECFDTHESDLIVLAEGRAKEIGMYLLDKGIGFSMFLSNVPGQSWYGKYCFDIPFMAGGKNDTKL